MAYIHLVDSEVVELGTGETAIIETPEGTIVIDPYDVEIGGEIVPIETGVHVGVGILEAVPLEPRPPPVTE